MTMHRLPSASDLAPGQLRRVEVAGRAICLARTQDGGLFAIDDTCTHEEETLSEGELMGCELECPFHFARFDLRTGEAVALPATEPVRTYRVEVDGDDVLIEEPPLQSTEGASGTEGVSEETKSGSR
ncbi:3-phenylpropionate/trans-cinnamate dioxygenase ferredoxin subunit [Nocardioides massiliensis]|uniref:3-phenylpropionate/trans-cinnamate dioxygenase ferredoxin subunit n=2 Tax=Nocardioides massiliensis TaxID=1325935 RepID=A0ABT9NL71_9ACTN|nr:non-heme iron oxygenase ferredoxin subunit [Nocardioides massiliensis]MDP9821148.1 3-phenylpropionate/trans-cinnamate dioxygenase ferredoxin subunit [Nocardioides massiliensis]